MSTEQVKRELEDFRNDKIKSLGFLCYNLFVDGVTVFPEMEDMVNNVKNSLTQMLVMQKTNAPAENLSMQESDLNSKLTELGCVCYNLYIDNKLFPNQVLSICDDISAINKELVVSPDQASTPQMDQHPMAQMDELKMPQPGIADTATVTTSDETEKVPEKDPIQEFLKEATLKSLAEKQNAQKAEKEEPAKPEESAKQDAPTEEPIPSAQNQFQVNYPYGMEMIPPNYRRCRCGYRNRPEAEYCAKCGKKMVAKEVTQ